MAVTTLIYLIILVNRVISQQSLPALNLVREVNTLSKGATVNYLELQVEATSETLPTATAGNNLNVAAPSETSLDLQIEISQAISTDSKAYSIENTKHLMDEEYATEKNNKSISLPNGTIADVKRGDVEHRKRDNSIIQPGPLVWENCYETNFKDSYLHLPDRHIDKSDVADWKNAKAGDGPNKRDLISTNDTKVVKDWLEKYKHLLRSKMEAKNPKQDLVLVKKITTNNGPSTPASSMKIVPITREVFVRPTFNYNSTMDVVLVTENNIESSFIEDWFDSKGHTKIKFGRLPQSENYLIPTLQLEEGFYPFRFVTDFFYLIYPTDFPVGLIKDIVSDKFDFPYSFLQSIKAESSFLAFIVIFACIALVIPVYFLVLGLITLFSNSSCDDEVETGALFPDVEDAKCNDNVLAVVTLFVVLLCCTLISGMGVSNEQARASVANSRNAVSCACADIAAWLAASARELHHSLVPPVDLVAHAYREDLKNVETLLGEPTQQAIASESGIDMVLDSLSDIIEESEDLATKIYTLRDVSIKAGLLASATSDKIRELARQLDNLKTQCTTKDVPLCDTVNTNSLEILIKFDLILHEPQLLELRTLGVENLTQSISTARHEFRSLPSVISTQTMHIREDITKVVEARRQAVHASARVYNDIARHLTSNLHFAARSMEIGLTKVQTFEFWRWVFMLGCVISFAFVMLLMMLAMLCGCGKTKGHAKRTLQTSAVLLCLNSLILWCMISATFLIAGHAEIFVCHALWDAPQYNTLSALLDRPSPLLEDGEGIFDAFFRGMDNVTIDVSVTDVLRDCEKDLPAYTVFQLDRVLDVNKETSYFEWDDLQIDLKRLASSIDVGFLQTISVSFNKLLLEMLGVTDVNLAHHRMSYNGPVVGKDLPSLVDQLENIAAQVTDLNTAGKMETLASRMQRLQLSNIKPLEQLRADLVYKLTELELQLMPFRRKINISLSHIHTAQYYINNQGDFIAKKKVATFISRLISHTAGWRTHVLESAGKHAARCGPLFAVYSAARALLCTRYLSSLHGWWVCGAFLGILWCIALTPLTVKLWRSYGRILREDEALALANFGPGTQETGTHTTMCEDNRWNMPRPPPPPRNDSW